MFYLHCYTASVIFVFDLFTTDVTVFSYYYCYFDAVVVGNNKYHMCVCVFNGFD